jgi:hypothetical protein
VPSSGSAAAGTEVLRLAGRASRRDAARRTDYLAHAYACHDMALRACDAEDEKVLRAMTLVWQILSDRCAPGPRNAAR